MFQAMGNTVPSLFTSSARIVIFFAIPAFLLGLEHQDFSCGWIWYLLGRSCTVQLVLTMWPLRREFGPRLRGLKAPVVQEMAS